MDIPSYQSFLHPPTTRNMTKTILAKTQPQVQILYILGLNPNNFKTQNKMS